MPGVTQAATVLTLNTSNGGRAINNRAGLDYQVGVNPVNVVNWRTDRANMGQTSNGQEFVQVWGFVATASFVADISNGMGANFSFDVGRQENLSGDGGGGFAQPTVTNVHFLDFKSFDSTDLDGSGNLSESAAEGALVTASTSGSNWSKLGEFSVDTANDFAVGSEDAGKEFGYAVGNASLAGVQNGDWIFFALDGTLDSSGVEKAFKPGSTAGDADALARITLTTVEVPEPSAMMLFGLAGLGIVRRRVRK